MDKFFITLYRILALPTIIVTAPYFIGRKLRRKNIFLDWPQRFGFLSNKLKKKDNCGDRAKKRIWIQAVSVGEVIAVESIIEDLVSSNEIDVILTTTTSTGYTEAKKRYGKKILFVGLFTIDFWPCTKLALSKIKPDLIILTESELWPEFLYQAKKRGIPIYLINARISNKSYLNLKKYKFFSNFVFNKINSIYPATKIDYNHFKSLGAKPLEIIGNIKIDVTFPAPINKEEKNKALINLFSNNKESNEPFVLIGASTWPGEEELLIESQKKCINEGIDCRLIIVPRHIERSESIKKLLNKQSQKWISQSNYSDGLKEGNNYKIYLSDTTGNLSNLIRLSDLAFIGKSTPPNNGGQNPIEAIAQGIPVITGPNMSNFENITNSLVGSGAAIKDKNKEDIIQSILNLSKDKSILNEMSKAGINWHEAERGISERITKDIIKNSII